MTINPAVAEALDRMAAAELPADVASDVGSEVDDPTGGFGRELSCVFDCTDSFATTTDPRVLITQAGLRRLITARGTLPARDDDDYGLDVRGMLHAGLTQTELRSLQSKIVGELKKDQRIESAIVRVVFATGRLTITGTITPRDPRLEAFPFTMTIDRAAAAVGVTT